MTCEVTRLGLVDRSGASTFARLCYRDALRVADREGALLLTTGLVNHLCETGYYINPVVVRETPDERAERIRLHGPSSDRLSLERMATLEWARRHDAGVLRQLDRWDGLQQVCNVGKDWVRGARAGMALNYGWDTDPKPGVTRMIQTLGTRHDDRHIDYSQITRLVRPVDSPLYLLEFLIDNIAPTLGSVARSLGLSW